MMHSIRWRLVFSYVALTLVTVTLLGFLAYSLIQEQIQTQERANLRSNAEVVAQQAISLMDPVTRLEELEELARTMGYLADLRVRVLTPERKILVDSGTPEDTGRVFWIPAGAMPSVEMQIEGLPDEGNPLVVSIPYEGEWSVLIPHDLPENVREAIVENAHIHEFQRVTGPWGPRLRLDETAAFVSTEAFTETRSTQFVEVPIGQAEQPQGFIQVLEGLSFRDQALQTTLQPFLMATAGSIVLAGVIGLVIGHRLSAPIIKLSQSAEKMGAGDLSVRVPNRRKDEIGQLGAQFNRMADRLEKSFTELSAERDTLRRFISDASHELRTPITALRNFIELLQDKAKRDVKAREQFLSESMHQIERLEWITHNLLNISRLEAGITPLTYEDIPVADLLEAAAAPYRAIAGQKQITLGVHPPDAELYVRADRGLLELALSNLIDNALKFTPPEGQVQIGARALEDGVRIWVRDNGVGIEARDLPHIFERFYRGRGQEAEGSGLGLALVKSVIDAHSGEVQVQSEPQAGSHFVLDIPQAVEEAA